MQQVLLSGFKLFLTSFMFCFLITSVAQAKGDDEAKQAVNHFLQVLNKQPAATLQDYQSLYGHVDHYELMLQWRDCGPEAQQAPLRNMECYNQVLAAWANKEKSPSLFLQLLGQYIPKTTDVKILSREILSSLDDLNGEKIVAKVDRHQLVFWRPSDKQDEYGALNLVEINGTPVFRLVQKASTPSVLMALGLKQLVRPLTEQELAAQEKVREERCNKNPECVKQREQQRKRSIEYEKEQAIRTVLAESFNQWCADNQQACEQDKKMRSQTSTKLRALSKDCEDDFDRCLNEVKAVLTLQKKDSPTPYCKAKPDDCNTLDEMRNRHNQESKARCKSNPEHCVESALTKAIRLGKEALGIN